MADGGHDDDRVHDVGSPGGGAGDASGTAGGLVFGKDVAGLEDREIWCWGPPRQAWARTTTGTSGRMRALVSSSCRARKSESCRSAARSAPVSYTMVGITRRPAGARRQSARPRSGTGGRAGDAGRGPCSPSYSAISSRAAARPAACRAAARAFSVAASASHADTGLPSAAAPTQCRFVWHVGPELKARSAAAGMDRRRVFRLPDRVGAVAARPSRRHQPGRLHLNAPAAAPTPKPAKRILPERTPAPSCPTATTAQPHPAPAQPPRWNIEPVITGPMGHRAG